MESITSSSVSSAVINNNSNSSAQEQALRQTQRALPSGSSYYTAANRHELLEENNDNSDDSDEEQDGFDWASIPLPPTLTSASSAPAQDATSPPQVEPASPPLPSGATYYNAENSHEILHDSDDDSDDSDEEQDGFDWTSIPACSTRSNDPISSASSLSSTTAPVRKPTALEEDSSVDSEEEIEIDDTSTTTFTPGEIQLMRGFPKIKYQQSPLEPCSWLLYPVPSSIDVVEFARVRERPVLVVTAPGWVRSPEGGLVCFLGDDLG